MMAPFLSLRWGGMKFKPKRDKGMVIQMTTIASSSSSMQAGKAMSGNLRLREFAKMYD